MKSATDIAQQLAPHIASNNAAIGETNRFLAKIGDGQGNVRPDTLLTPRDVFYRSSHQNDRGVAILSPRCPIPLQAIDGYYDVEVWVANVPGSTQPMIVDLADTGGLGTGGPTPAEGLANSAAVPDQSRLLILRLRPSDSGGISVFVDVGPYSIVYEIPGGGVGFFSSQDMGFPDPTDDTIFVPTAAVLASGEHRIVGIALDPLTGSLFAIPGVEAAASDTLPQRDDFIEADYQAIDFTGYFPAGYTYNYYGQTDIEEDDCLRNYDPRLFMKRAGSNVYLYTPTDSADPAGSVGDIALDDDHIHWKTVGNGWVRAAGATF